MNLLVNVRPFRFLVGVAALSFLGMATCPPQPTVAPDPPHVIGIRRSNRDAATVYDLYGKIYQGVLPSQSVKVMITPMPLEVGFDVAIDGIAVPRVVMDQMRGDDAKWALEYNVTDTGTTEALIIMPQVEQRNRMFHLTISSRRGGLTSPPVEFDIGFFGFYLPRGWSASGSSPTPAPQDPAAGPCGDKTPDGKEKEYSFAQKCLGIAFDPIPAAGCTRDEARHRARLLLQYACILTEIEDKPIVPDPPPVTPKPCTVKSFKFCVTCDDGSHAPNISTASADGCALKDDEAKAEAEAKVAGVRPFFCTIKDGACSH